MGSNSSCLGKSDSPRRRTSSLKPSSDTTSQEQGPIEDQIPEHLKDYDQEKSLSNLTTPTNEVVDLNEVRANAAALIQKQARLKAAKIRAENEKRWLVLSNLDTVAEADMVHVANFMQTVCLKVPQLTQLMNREKSCQELNKYMGDDPPPPSDFSFGLHNLTQSHNINVSRLNSQNFITALRQLNEVQQQDDDRLKLTSSVDSQRQAAGLTTSNNTSTNRPKSSHSHHNHSSHQHHKSHSHHKNRKPYWNGTGSDPGAPPASELRRSPNKHLKSSTSPDQDFDNSQHGSSNSSVSNGHGGGNFSPAGGNSAVNASRFADVFAFDTIALSSELEKKTTLESMIPDSELHNYDLPAGPITSYSVDLLIALYKKNGKLSKESLHKILRISYKRLKEMTNITHLPLIPNDQVTVVGDLHGQLSDLMYILEDSGLPSKVSKYVFNGDFVDRGLEGVEVTAILLSMFCAFPGSVCLNRGNHEDFAVCCAYGFQMECRTKYDNVTFGMFVEIFQNLPLFTIVDNTIMIVHGGLFHCPDTTLTDLEAIVRQSFMLSDVHMDGVSTDPVPREQTDDFLRQLQRDALWSDPSPAPGLHLNPRGAGVSFGPDITHEFLVKNNLKMIVRSHECVRTGFDKPYIGTEYSEELCTVFSASNYYGAGNTAAFMIFRKELKVMEDPRYTPVLNTDLYYSVFYFITNSGLDDDETKTTVGDVSSSLGQTLFDLVLNNKVHLIHEFKTLDIQNNGVITKKEWADTMHKVMKLQLQWISMFPFMVTEECYTTDPITNITHIHYEKFLDNFTATFVLDSHTVNEPIIENNDVDILKANENAKTITLDDGDDTSPVSNMNLTLSTIATTTAFDKTYDVNNTPPSTSNMTESSPLALEQVIYTTSTTSNDSYDENDIRQSASDDTPRITQSEEVVDLTYDDIETFTPRGGEHKLKRPSKSGAAKKRKNVNNMTSTTICNTPLPTDVNHTQLRISIDDSIPEEGAPVMTSPVRQSSAKEIENTISSILVSSPITEVTTKAATTATSAMKEDGAVTKTPVKATTNTTTTLTQQQQQQQHTDDDYDFYDEDSLGDGAGIGGYSHKLRGSKDENDEGNNDNDNDSECTFDDDQEELDELDAMEQETIKTSQAVLEALYSQHRLLETVFRFFDVDNTGTISAVEFKQGCELINQTLPEEHKIRDYDRLLNVMDISETGEIDINEFFEMFRLSDAKLNISNMINQSKNSIKNSFRHSAPNNPNSPSSRTAEANSARASPRASGYPMRSSYGSIHSSVSRNSTPELENRQPFSTESTPSNNTEISTTVTTSSATTTNSPISPLMTTTSSASNAGSKIDDTVLKDLSQNEDTVLTTTTSTINEPINNSNNHNDHQTPTSSSTTTSTTTTTSNSDASSTTSSGSMTDTKDYDHTENPKTTIPTTTTATTTTTTHDNNSTSQ